MLGYIIKRIFLAIITLFIVASLTFFLMNLIPGGPFLAEKAPSEATLAALNEKYGLDQPLHVQYFRYMGRLVRGDLGISLKQRGQSVNNIISTKFPVSAKIGGIAVVLALVLGIPMGAYAALKRGRWLDKLISVVSTLGIAIPSFVVATVLMVIFSARLGWLPSYGLSSPAHYIMPVIALAFYPTAYISRLMRSSMLDVLGQDYMRTARAKGVPAHIGLFKHALRNAILPIVTYLGPLLAYTLAGSFVIEKIFTIPGLGSEFISSIVGRDYPMVMGTTIFFAGLLITLNLVIDILYKFVDPRISFK